MRSYKLWALCCVLVSALELVTSQANETDRCQHNSVTTISCENVDTTNSLLPHPDDCQLFYYCVQPYLPPVCRECPSNLHFNPSLSVCDWPHQAGCQVGNNSEEFPNTDESTTEYISVNETNTDSNTTTATSCERIYDLIYNRLPDYLKALDYATLKNLLYDWLRGQSDWSDVVEFIDENC